MRIAFFNYLMLEYGGGLAMYFEEVSCGLKKRYPDLEISIVTFNDEVSKKIARLYSIYFFRGTSKKLNSKRKPEALKKKLGTVTYYKARSVSDLRKILSGFDVIYSKNDFLEAVILKVLVGYSHLKTVVFGFHTPVKYDNIVLFHSKLHNVLYKSFLYNYLLTGVQKFHVLNSFDEKLLRKRFPAKTIEKIYNPFDFDDFVNRASKKNQKFYWDKNKFNLLWSGRLTPEKGADDLVFLINSINSTNHKNNLVWNIVGEGEYADYIIKLKGKWSNVRYLGFVKPDYIPGVYKSSDLFLSTSKFETLPYTFLEAQSFGLPIISYKIHGVDEIIRDGKNGYLVSSIDEMKKEILLLFSAIYNTFCRNDDS